METKLLSIRYNLQRGRFDLALEEARGLVYQIDARSLSSISEVVIFKIIIDDLVKFHPLWVKTLFSLGLLFKKKDEIALAIYCFTRLSEMIMTGGVWDAICNLADCYCELEMYHEAITVYSDFLENSPEKIFLLTGIATIYKRQQKYRLAEKYFKDALELDPNSVFVLNGLAETYRVAGNINLAKTILLRSLKIDPDNQDTKRALAEVYAVENQYELALKFYEAGNDRKSRNYGRVLMRFGVQLFNNGDYSRAQVYFEKMVRLNRDHRDARKYLRLIRTRKIT